MADKYDECFLGNANVPNIGKTTESSGAPAPPSTTNSNPATSQADGTVNPRADTQTKDAAPNASPTAIKTNWPAGVDHYTDKAGEDPEK